MQAQLLKRTTDVWIPLYRQYLKIESAGGVPTLSDHSNYELVAAAVALNRDEKQTALLKIMVAADMNSAEIFERLGVRAETTAAWEALFYDIRDLRQASSWIATHVIAAERNRGNDELAGRLKLAHFSGASAVHSLLDFDQAIPLDVADDLFQKRVRLQVKVDQALCGAAGNLAAEIAVHEIADGDGS